VADSNYAPFHSSDLSLDRIIIAPDWRESVAKDLTVAAWLR
jgi:hypothetical protein